MTPEQDAMLRDVLTQLRGPSLAGWPQLGTDAEGRARTLVDGLAVALRRVDELTTETARLRAEVRDLRTEISELEATSAELTARLRGQAQRRLPWPLSLVEESVESIAARLEALLPEADRREPGRGTARWSRGPEDAG
ncbi:hypothetical protein [Nocardia farcinica]|nr:hypothetical protein [Nocardia farcinica]